MTLVVPQPQPLEHSWTLWFDNPVEVQAGCLGSSMRPIYTFATVEEFWSVTCILRWATYGQKPTCPKCKTQFSYLNVHRSVDGSLHDYMFEESVCLLLRAPWFKHLTVDQHKEVCDPYAYEEADDPYEEDLDETYLRNSSSNRIRRRAKRACRREACS